MDLDLLNMSEDNSHVVFQHCCNTGKAVLCLFAFQERLQLHLKHLEIELIPTIVLFVMRLFCQSRRAAGVSHGPTD